MDGQLPLDILGGDTNGFAHSDDFSAKHQAKYFEKELSNPEVNKSQSGPLDT